MRAYTNYNLLHILGIILRNVFFRFQPRCSEEQRRWNSIYLKNKAAYLMQVELINVQALEKGHDEGAMTDRRRSDHYLDMQRDYGD